LRRRAQTAQTVCRPSYLYDNLTTKNRNEYNRHNASITTSLHGYSPTVHIQHLRAIVEAQMHQPRPLRLARSASHHIYHTSQHTSVDHILRRASPDAVVTTYGGFGEPAAPKGSEEEASRG
jgi:hypothetical protein